MLAIFPVQDVAALLSKAEQIWNECNEEDGKEAFTYHPMIGDVQVLSDKFRDTANWAQVELAAVHNTSRQVLEELAECNELYEKKFGYIFIVFATGKSAEEMLSMLKLRMPNTAEDEIEIAMEEQNKITLLRLKNLLE